MRGPISTFQPSKEQDVLWCSFKLRSYTKKIPNITANLVRVQQTRSGHISSILTLNTDATELCSVSFLLYSWLWPNTVPNWSLSLPIIATCQPDQQTMVRVQKRDWEICILVWNNSAPNVSKIGCWGGWTQQPCSSNVNQFLHTDAMIKKVYQHICSPRCLFYYHVYGLLWVSCEQGISLHLMCKTNQYEFQYTPY